MVIWGTAPERETEMGKAYRDEVKLIRDARDAEPHTKVMTLAKKLGRLGGLEGRSLLSIYSVIRRYDASKKVAAAKTAKLAKTASKALASV